MHSNINFLVHFYIQKIGIQRLNIVHRQIFHLTLDGYFQISAILVKQRKAVFVAMDSKVFSVLKFYEFDSTVLQFEKNTAA